MALGYPRERRHLPYPCPPFSSFHFLIEPDSFARRIVARVINRASWLRSARIGGGDGCEWEWFDRDSGFENEKKVKTRGVLWLAESSLKTPLGQSDVGKLRNRKAGNLHPKILFRHHVATLLFVQLQIGPSPRICAAVLKPMHWKGGSWRVRELNHREVSLRFRTTADHGIAIKNCTTRNSHDRVWVWERDMGNRY